MLTAAVRCWKNFIRDKFGVKVRSIELNVNQRCSGMMASATDIEESVLAGRRRKGCCLRADLSDGRLMDRAASGWFAVISGRELIFASSIMIASHSVWPAHRLLPEDWSRRPGGTGPWPQTGK